MMGPSPSWQCVRSERLENVVLDVPFRKNHQYIKSPFGLDPLYCLTLNLQFRSCALRFTVLMMLNVELNVQIILRIAPLHVTAEEFEEGAEINLALIAIER